MEEWRPVVGYEGLYEVSNMGRVKSLGNGRSNNSKERILKVGKTRGGYLQVLLYKDDVRKNYSVHRLVAEAFIPNPNNLPQVNHVDENKENNYVDNLEWCSHKYNSNYGTKNQRAAEKLRGRKHSEEHTKKVAEKHRKPIYSINKVSGLIMYWNSAAEAGKALGINFRNISACCKGKRNSAGGFYWMFANVNDDDTE